MQEEQLDPIGERADRFYTQDGLDRDTPIYRFMSWQWVRDLLEKGKLVLVRPESWEDPYELIDRPVQIRVRRGDASTSRILPGSRFEIFSQSWTTRNMADTMLRAYSRLSPADDDGTTFDPVVHKAESVQISTTVGKLHDALRRALEGVPGFERLYLTRVTYHADDALIDHVGGLVANGPNSMKDPHTIATMLSLKRDAYFAENEIRPIVLFDDSARGLERLTVSIDAEDTIDSICIDPRVGNHSVSGFPMHAHQNRRAFLADCGFELKIVDSHLYTASPLIDLTIDLDSAENKLSDDSRMVWSDYFQESQSRV